MGFRFRNFFRKRDRKDGENNHSNKEDARHIIRVQPGKDEMAKRLGARKHSFVQRRTSDSLTNDPIYLNKLYGISNEGTIRLFKKPSEEENNFPDRPQYKRKEEKLKSSVNRPNRNNLQVYTASVTRDSSPFNPPSSSRPSEPFPYKVYDSPPRRSTLHYGVDYEGKPTNFDGNVVPSTSQNDGFNHPHLQNDKEISVQQGRRVTIVTPNEMGDIPPMNNYENETNDLETESVRKTVLRFRPHSSASINSSESVKLMVFRADQIEHPPMVLSRHVHQFPLKRIKRTPLLMTDDGRVLKPIDTDKQARNSFRVNKEESRVRLSMVDIENMCQFPRKSTEIIDPVLHSRNSMNRNSIRQSLISKQIVDEKRSSILRENREEPKMSYHYSLEENHPMVHGVPVIPSRNRSNSHLSRQSVTSYDLKNDQGLGNEDTRYYVSENERINKQVRYSRGPYQPDYIIMNKDKPITVYEVHNFENNTTKNKDSCSNYTKPQQNGAQKRFVTNQPTQKIKEKQSFRSKTRAQKNSENNMSDSRPVYLQQPVDYVAEVPSGTLPAPKVGTSKCPFKKNRSRTSFSTKEKAQSKDFCGLTCEPQEKTNSNFKMVSSSQQTDFENDVDFLCYPAEKLSNNPTSLNESVKWRILIKKQENK